MRISELPFNIDILDTDKRNLQRLRPVTSNQLMDGKTNEFQEDGLFSITTFGALGSDDRFKRFSYIDMNTEILHPLLYKELIRLKSLYRGILSGKAYAVWDEELGDFVRSNELEGKTGYSFFISKLKDLKFKRKENNNLNANGKAKESSDKRELRVKLIEKFKDRALVRNLVVIPAGLRELEIDEKGRQSYDEINDLYRKALSISNSITFTSEDKNNPIQDTSRWALQLTFLEIYETLRSMIEGKKGFLQAKWSSRRIFDGTRNVISAMSYDAPESTSPRMPGINDTQVGLYQYMKGTTPIMINAIMESEIGRDFGSTEGAVPLVNPKTLELEYVNISNKTKDLWTTMEGIKKVINSYVNLDLRHSPIMIEGYFAGLIYDDGENFKIFKDLNTLPEDFSKDKVRPLTWTEYFYVICYERSKKVAGLVTRYPITGIGSIYPTKIYLKTTVNGGIRKPLGYDWKVDESRPVANEMPIAGEPFLQSLSPHLSRLQGLGGDFDGDTTSFNIVYTKQGAKELLDLLDSELAYIDPRGGFQQAMTDTIEWTALNMTS